MALLSHSQATLLRADIRVIDDRGAVFTMPASAKTVVSLAPHLTENLFAIGAGDLIVGVTTYSNHPPAALEIEVIGTYKDFDIERIIELNPDIVFGWISGNPSEPIRKMEQVGLPLFLTEPREPEQVADEIRRLGVLTGREQAAVDVANTFMEEISQLRNQYAGREVVRVFYQIWNEPLITLGGDHLISKLINDCGGLNIFADLSSLAPRVSIESVLERDPEAIITGGMGDQRPQWLDDWKRYDFLSAARGEHLFHVHPDLVQRHTIRLAAGMRILCEQIDSVRRHRIANE